MNQEALAALTELQCVRQTVGKVGYMLRRCKPGTKRHKELWDSLTKLETDAERLSSIVRLALEGM